MSKAATMQKLLDHYMSSGESQRNFCLREGINYYTFKYWQKKLTVDQRTKSSFVRIEKPVENHCFLGLELEFPNGVKVRNLNSLALVSQLIFLEKCSV